MKTGNTGGQRQERAHGISASMEPGHEDREYATPPPAFFLQMRVSLNGARS